MIKVWYTSFTWYCYVLFCVQD